MKKTEGYPEGFKKIILCADDYGINQEVNEGILHLLQNQRLSAVSCLVTKSDFQKVVRPLLDFEETIDVGLHLNLTEPPFGTSAMNQSSLSLKCWILRALFRMLSYQTIYKEFECQLLGFREAVGCWPHFLDGHQHVHHLPVVRTVVLDLYEKYLRPYQPYIRSCQSVLNFSMDGLKRGVIDALGGSVFRKHMKKREIPYNRSFSGIYSYRTLPDYRSLFLKFCQEIDHQGIMMCHPAKIETQVVSGFDCFRQNEYHYLISDDFEGDCKRAGVCLGRFVETDSKS